jgi:hypothetical protein
VIDDDSLVKTRTNTCLSYTSAVPSILWYSALMCEKWKHMLANECKGNGTFFKSIWVRAGIDQKPCYNLKLARLTLSLAVTFYSSLLTEVVFDYMYIECI